MAAKPSAPQIVPICFKALTPGTDFPIVVPLAVRSARRVMPELTRRRDDPAALPPFDEGPVLIGRSSRKERR